MLNILIPISGKSNFFDNDEYQFPKPLIEINGKSMIELIIENLNTINDDKQFIFVINKEDNQQFHLENVLNLITNNNCKVVTIQGETKGAACSCLMAIEYINNRDNLLICNGDQIIDYNIDSIINDFKQRELDAGVLCFDSVHPKWSFVRLDDEENIIETAEKRPISKNSIAGFYYFNQGRDFVDSVKKSIAKDANVNGLFYIAPTLNEMVLTNKKLGIYKFDKKFYHSLYSPQKIKEYEKLIEGCNETR